MDLNLLIYLVVRCCQPERGGGLGVHMCSHHWPEHQLLLYSPSSASPTNLLGWLKKGRRWKEHLDILGPLLTVDTSASPRYLKMSHYPIWRWMQAHEHLYMNFKGRYLSPDHHYLLPLHWHFKHFTWEKHGIRSSFTLWLYGSLFEKLSVLCWRRFQDRSHIFCTAGQMTKRH